MTTLHTYLVLGRVSNLPTVWTNACSAWVLSGTPLAALPLAMLVTGFSLFYVAGMYLNDVFDSAVDAVERPERPIPAGLITRAHALRCGTGLLLAGVICLALARALAPAAGSSGQIGWMLCTAVLIGAIIAYNRYHKHNPLSPLIMGACRVMLLVTGSVVLGGSLPPAVLIGSGLLFSYLIGLTWIARFEVAGGLRTGWPAVLLLLPLMAGLLWLQTGIITALTLLLLAAVILLALYRANRAGSGDIPQAVAMLIAGISLLDALLMAAYGQPGWALLACLAFALTLTLQRGIRGT